MVIHTKIQRMFYREHLSINEVQRRTSLSRNTIKKWPQVPSDSTVKYQRAKKPDKLMPFESRLMLALSVDVRRPKKDHRAASLLFKEILNEGYAGELRLFAISSIAGAVKIARATQRAPISKSWTK
ncbi:hypothetical protein C8R34_10767 [Nitrosomonas sp. Nm84]|uniref:hypothetical protein n=1 Tax=Nitrosomonas sp. Nm84 TaxID=200124 RepID=UPI000D9C9980|nr:hypothetical protein [Nitrosomonas sp. Nm84]PXW88384.1 hypothetical protein C8R34_10767 [Nitrosomonas sp. Nm84]